jgi:prophage regulatory protein
MAIVLLKPAEAARRCAIGRSTLFSLVAGGHFPQPVHIGKRTTGFIESEVDAWLEARAAERTKQE